MARITIDDVQAWVEDSKLNPQSLDLDYLSQIEEEILARLASVYDVTTWTSETTTPRLIQVIIAKTYSGWLYDKYYSENQGVPNEYAQMVKANAESLIDGLLAGTVTIVGIIPVNAASASYYPNDASSLLDPLDPQNDSSVGPAKFSMGRVF